MNTNGPVWAAVVAKSPIGDELVAVVQAGYVSDIVVFSAGELAIIPVGLVGNKGHHFAVASSLFTSLRSPIYSVITRSEL